MPGATVVSRPPTGVTVQPSPALRVEVTPVSGVAPPLVMTIVARTTSPGSRSPTGRSSFATAPIRADDAAESRSSTRLSCAVHRSAVALGRRPALTCVRSHRSRSDAVARARCTSAAVRRLSPAAYDVPAVAVSAVSLASWARRCSTTARSSSPASSSVSATAARTASAASPRSPSTRSTAKAYEPEPISKTAVPPSIFTNRTPSACSAAFPPSVTAWRPAPGGERWRWCWRERSGSGACRRGRRASSRC